MRWFLLSLALAVSVAQSQERPPENIYKENTQAGKAAQKADSDKQGTKENPFVVKRIDAEETQERREQMRTERDEKAANERGLVIWTVALAVTTMILAFIAAGQLVMFWKQLGLMRDGAKDAENLAIAAKTQASAMMLAGRAYVKLSHVPPGIQMESDRFFWMTLQVKNFGNTPALITEVFLTVKLLHKTSALPSIPDYGKPDRQPRQAFLVRNEKFFFSTSPQQLTEGDLRNIKAEFQRMYVMGFVDYMDNFGGRHRAGYARIYRADLDDRRNFDSDEEFSGRNNLVFVDQSGYNYDRPREKGEGNDWDT